MENQEKENEQALLLEEYKVNVDLWQHDDNLRQQRTGNFLTVNTILIAIVSALIGASTELGEKVFIAGIFVSLFGVVISFIWDRILKRNAQYIRFRRLQLNEIEQKLQPLSTFQNTYKAFEDHQPVDFKATDQTFPKERSTGQSSTRNESRLPTVIIVFWVIVIIALIVLHVTYEPEVVQEVSKCLHS